MTLIIIEALFWLSSIAIAVYLVRHYFFTLVVLRNSRNHMNQLKVNYSSKSEVESTISILIPARNEGHVIGSCFHADLSETPYTRAAGESDEAVFADDDPHRTMWGTGNEDFVNDAWGFHDVVGALSGGRATRSDMFGYRFHLPDVITFRKKLAFTLEHGSSNNCTAKYRSVVYYYLKAGGPNRFIDGVPGRDMKRYFDY